MPNPSALERYTRLWSLTTVDSGGNDVCVYGYVSKLAQPLKGVFAESGLRVSSLLSPSDPPLILFLMVCASINPDKHDLQDLLSKTLLQRGVSTLI